MSTATGNGIAGRLSDLVRADEGLVSRELFNDPALYELELEKVFPKSWLFLCHESQLRQPGDFISTYMGEDPVVVCRAKDGVVRAFLNSCRHRGMRICRADLGNASAFTCPYHAWTYANDGRLIGVPNFKDAYKGEINKDEWGLVPVPRLESYAGLIFGNWDAEAVTLDEYIGDFKYYMDLAFSRRPGGIEFAVSTHKWTMPCNWKFAADNFVGDMYHAPYSHGSAARARVKLGEVPPAAVSALTQFPMMQISPGGGHGAGVSLMPLKDRAGRQFSGPIIQNYLESVGDETEAWLGERSSSFGSIVHATLFPNFSFLGTGTVRVWHPKGPGRMEVWAWVYYDRDAPPEVKDEIRRQSTFNFSAAGMFEQDDGENWNQCTASSSGYVARKYPFSYQMGLGHEERMEEHPGRHGSNFAEINQRGFYQRWQELMTAPASNPA